MLSITFSGWGRTMLLLFMLSHCSGSTLDDVMNLHNTLFVTSNYNRHIRGLFNQSGLIRVGANFSVLSLGEVMEREEAFSVMGLLLLLWKDERLAWNASDYNGTSHIEVYQDTIWKPEVNLANPMSAVDPLGNERRQIKIFNTGYVFWLIPDMFAASCDIDVVSFPWDRQSCSLEFVVSTYATNEVIIEADSEKMNIAEESEQWDIVKTTVANQADGLSRVVFSFCLERRPAFHLAVMLIPIIALSVLNVFVFLVKVDSGERISFSITLLLSITLYLSMTASSLPSHSKGMSAIIYCLNFVLAESMFICMISIYSQHVYHKQGAPSFTWQKIAMKLLGRKCDKVRHEDQSDTVKKFTADESPEYKKDHDADFMGEENLGITWMDVSLLIDRAFFLLASVAIITSFIIFATFVVNSKTVCK